MPQDPDFNDLTTRQKLEALCLTLLEHREAVRRLLDENDRSRDFSERIDTWHTAHGLDGQDFDPQTAGDELFEICETFGIVDLIVDQKYFTAVATRGAGPSVMAVYRRGATAGRPVPRVFTRLREIAALYRR